MATKLKNGNKTKKKFKQNLCKGEAKSLVTACISSCTLSLCAAHPGYWPLKYPTACIFGSDFCDAIGLYGLRTAISKNENIL